MGPGTISKSWGVSSSRKVGVMALTEYYFITSNNIIMKMTIEVKDGKTHLIFDSLVPENWMAKLDSKEIEKEVEKTVSSAIKATGGNVYITVNNILPENWEFPKMSDEDLEAAKAQIEKELKAVLNQANSEQYFANRQKTDGGGGDGWRL